MGWCQKSLPDRLVVLISSYYLSNWHIASKMPLDWLLRWCCYWPVKLWPTGEDDKQHPLLEASQRIAAGDARASQVKIPEGIMKPKGTSSDHQQIGHSHSHLHSVYCIPCCTIHIYIKVQGSTVCFLGTPITWLWSLIPRWCFIFY